MKRQGNEIQVKRTKTGQFAKGTPMKAGPGRPKKIKGTGRPFEDLVLVYEKLGGIAGMVQWAAQNNSNRVEFYKMLIRSVPKELIDRLFKTSEEEQDRKPGIQFIMYDAQIALARVEQLESLLKEHKIALPKSEDLPKLPEKQPLKTSTELLTEKDSEPQPEEPKQLKEPKKELEEPPQRLLTATEILKKHERKQVFDDKSWVTTAEDDN